MLRKVTTVEDLRAIVGHPTSYVANKVGPRLSSVQEEWLRAASFGFVATVDAQGHLDVSPKGDPAGFVHPADQRQRQGAGRRRLLRRHGSQRQAAHPRAGDQRGRGVLPLRQGFSAVYAESRLRMLCRPSRSWPRHSNRI